MQVEEIRVAGVPALVYRAGRTALTIIPQWGGKGVSLRHGVHEFLDVDEAQLGPVAGLHRFAETMPLGWDEMLPTIREAEYPDGKYARTHLADHGDCWNQAWTQGPTLATWQVQSRLLPIRMSRTVCVRDGEVELQYRFWNQSEDMLYLFHAPHPLFLVRQGSEVEIPGIRQVELVAGREPRRTVNFPMDNTFLPPRDLSRVQLHRSPSSFKYYTQHQPEYARLHHPDGSAVTVRASPLYVTFAVWVNQRGYRDRAQVAIEPCTAFYEDIPTALAENRIPQLPPRAALDGTVTLALREGHDE